MVYQHLTSDTGKVFYIGEGRPGRAFSKRNRNRWWRYVEAKHGFEVKILAENLSKETALDLERLLMLEARELGLEITNICSGSMFADHWLLNAPKENHPMFGKRFKAPWVTESNKRRTGSKMKPRPDLVERNKSGNFKRYTKKVRCITTNETFNSVKEASLKYNFKPHHMARAIKMSYRLAGMYWCW